MGRGMFGQLSLSYWPQAPRRPARDHQPFHIQGQNDHMLPYTLAITIAIYDRSERDQFLGNNMTANPTVTPGYICQALGPLAIPQRR
jgi:hypothetical protein